MSSAPVPELQPPAVLRRDALPEVSQAHGEVDVLEWPELSKPPGRRLGTHRDLDRRRVQFAVEATAGWLLPPKDVSWQRFVPIFDQGDCGGAAAFAIVGALGSEPLLREEMRQQPVHLPSGETTTFFDVRAAQYTVDLAMAIYGQATHLDDVGAPDNVWPSTDPGTTADAVCQVVRRMGLISGWGHCMGASSVPHALQMYGPVLMSLPWYEGFDEPAPVGAELRIDGAVRGGNTLLCRRYEHGDTPDTSWFWLDSNWGTGYGIDGQARISVATLRQLYNEGAHAVAIKTGNPRA